jgi:hypothetical protein
MKQIANLYLFNASERKVTVRGLTIPQASLLLVVNSSRNQVLHDASAGPGVSAYEFLAGDTVVTLVADTTSFADSDSLTIYYEDGSNREESTTIADLDTIKGSRPAAWLTDGNAVPVSAILRGAAVQSLGIVGPASVQVAAGNPERKYLLVQNLSEAAMHLGFGEAATLDHTRIDAGGSISFEQGFVPTDLLELKGVQSGQKYCLITS